MEGNYATVFRTLVVHFDKNENLGRKIELFYTYFKEDCHMAPLEDSERKLHKKIIFKKLL